MTLLNALALPSKRLILSYIFDWVVIFAIAGLGGGFHQIGPYHRPFSLLDLSISYPYNEHETIPTWLLLVCSLIAPGVIIFLVCIALVPGRVARTNSKRLLVWKCKLWEWNTGWMGLGLSLAIAFMVTEGMKNLFGKPRPDLLSRCNPDLNAIGANTVGGFGTVISDRWTLVNSGICQQPDKSLLDDGFRSFPSGHSSFSWAGLLYLSLFMCSKFAIAIPFLPPRFFSTDLNHTALSANHQPATPRYNDRNPNPKQPSRGEEHSPSPTLRTHSHLSNSTVPIRNQAAAPPTYILVLALIPIGAATYISSTRYSDFRHKGFDILFGSTIGIISSWFSFRWYHLPIRNGAGWAWGARSRDRAWGIGVGEGNYVGEEGWGSKKAREMGKGDLEAGTASNANTTLEIESGTVQDTGGNSTPPGR